ncbi:MAG: enoyl-CoA hydratase/isomerase family protein [Phenylobacterium sp.]|uniref:enoyl-CoA hydratase/isomerase family protein n=1 Tax=Phenylobacterium sp. TaxID=1871053 RepID=UPI0025E4FEC7|nr:enoyl-CoA hydratase/isomerase family protein [Phenylobacterium sp.]MBI1196367.1 enoyl-CoA hydratase/isomerase family protein [Phenylobacterium sp.]
MDRLFEGEWRLIRVEKREGIVEVALNRPEARNALNGELMEELTEAARLLRLRTDVRAVILSGGEAYFSAGADLSASEARRAQPSLLESRRAIMAGPDLCRAWEEIEAVTIAAIEGYCIGGGAALVLSCDFRVMGEGAYLRLPEVPLGMNMSWRSLPRIVALAGPSRAKQFVMFGEALDAARCLDWGIADEAVAKGGALAAARRWADKVAALPPIPIRMTKEAVNALSAATAHASIYMDRDQYLLATSSQDFREGVAAFREKRPGKFTGA